MKTNETTKPLQGVERELRSQRDIAFEEVKKLQSQLTDAKVASMGLTEELAWTDAKLSEQTLIDAGDKLRTELTQFIGSGVEGLVQRLLSSDEFHAALAHVASLSYCGSRRRSFQSDPNLAGQACSFGHTSVPIAPPIVSEASDQVPLDHASDDSASSI
ncbi:hypothetical protein Tco_0524675 [Tanacetum coccineum]